MKNLIMALVLFLVSPLQAGEAVSIPKSQLAQFVVEHLDVKSFRSSLGPRREKEKVFFKDYGFYPTNMVENSARLEEADKGWHFNLKVLGQRDSHVLICLEDKCLDGGTYHTQKALSLVLDNKTGLLRAEDHNISDKRCPEFAR